MTAHRYLLDTNILSALARDPHGRATQAMHARLPHTCCTSIVVVSEVQFGLQRGASARVHRQMETILSGIDVLPLSAPADEHYGDIRAHLERLGTPIGANDLFIAAHARALGLVLVTDNLREFQRVPGLALENWLA